MKIRYLCKKRTMFPPTLLIMVLSYKSWIILPLHNIVPAYHQSSGSCIVQLQCTLCRDSSHWTRSPPTQPQIHRTTLCTPKTLLSFKNQDNGSMRSASRRRRWCECDKICMTLKCDLQSNVIQILVRVWMHI